jgi:hypothetical protein
MAQDVCVGRGTGTTSSRDVGVTLADELLPTHLAASRAVASLSGGLRVARLGGLCYTAALSGSIQCMRRLVEG